MTCPETVLFSRFGEPRLALGATTGLGGRTGVKDEVSLTGTECLGGQGLGAGTGADWLGGRVSVVGFGVT